MKRFNYLLVSCCAAFSCIIIYSSIHHWIFRDEIHKVNPPVETVIVEDQEEEIAYRVDPEQYEEIDLE